MTKPLPRLIDMRERMRQNQAEHDIRVDDHYQLTLHPDDRRLFFSCYQTGDIEQFLKLHYLIRLEAFRDSL